MDEKKGPLVKRLDPFRLQVGDGIIYLDKRLEESLCEKALQQVVEACKLPDSKVVVMPDIHFGYGLPIGGVLASKNLISAEAVGVDINCGVRLLSLSSSLREKRADLKALLHSFLKAVPAGVGEENSIFKGEKPNTHLLGVLSKGASYISEEMGFGRKEDLLKIEDRGRLETKKKRISDLLSSFQKGDRKTFFYQLGTLGSGNHFIEIQEVKEIFDQERAKAFNIDPTTSYIMLHTGSRNFGNTLALRYIKLFRQKASDFGLGGYKLPAAPLRSPLGEEYFYAMNAAANYAFANRQLITSLLDRAIKDFLGDHIEVKTIYDLAHNIAKKEKHGGVILCLHRKGATRAFPSGHEDLSIQAFKEHGHPAIIPGSMGSLSYLVAGTKKAFQESFGTVSHGAGRVISRKQAKKTFDKKEFQRFKKKNLILSGSGDSLLDEAPEAYKDSAAVISVLKGAGLIYPVASFRPLATIKG